MATQPRRRRFSVSEYYQMARAGILDEDSRVELIDGEIIEMTPIGRRHAAHVDRLADRFFRTFGDVAQIRVQNPVRLNEYTEPQPDLMLLRPRPDFYVSHHPRPEDVYLLAEVADTSVDYDRRLKVPLYARNGLPEVWLEDLEPETITAYRDPTPNGYLTAQVFHRGEQIAPVAFPERRLAVDDILG